MDRPARRVTAGSFVASSRRRKVMGGGGLPRRPADCVQQIVEKCNWRRTPGLMLIDDESLVAVRWARLRQSWCGNRGAAMTARDSEREKIKPKSYAIYIGVTGDVPHQSQREAYKVDSTVRCDDATPTWRKAVGHINTLRSQPRHPPHDGPVRQTRTLPPQST